MIITVFRATKITRTKAFAQSFVAVNFTRTQYSVKTIEKTCQKKFLLDRDSSNSISQELETA